MFIFRSFKKQSNIIAQTKRQAKCMYSVEKGVKEGYEAVIGLEVHAQIASNCKIFSKTEFSFGNSPNASVCLLDAGFPGALPVLNEKCVSAAVLTGLALNGNIQQFSSFDRKHYFYPDMPNGYQITQHRNPIVLGGNVTIHSNNAEKTIELERIHLEQDSGKSIHMDNPSERWIDLNRSGVGLMEIVTHPHLNSGEEAHDFVRALRNILKEIGTCNTNIAAGEMRVDANISVHKPGTSLGTRVEIKNIAGSRNLQLAIDLEIKRQIDLLCRGNVIKRETRNYEQGEKSTSTLREKEDEKDYRYMPEPDLPPLILTEEYIKNLRASLPELPSAKTERFIKQYKLNKHQCRVLFDRGGDSYFEKICKSRIGKHDLAGSLVIVDVLKIYNEKKLEYIDESLIKPSEIGELVDAHQAGLISAKNARKVVPLLIHCSKPVIDIIKENDWLQITDQQQIDGIVKDVFAGNEMFIDYLAGNEKIIGRLLGVLNKATDGRIATAKALEAIHKLKEKHMKK